MGLILLTGLSLPPKLRHKPAYSFVFRIIPGPNSPHTITIQHILNPLAYQLLKVHNGVNISTISRLQGRNVYLQLIPLIGDLVAVHKALGVASHFFPWCDSQLPDLHLMKLGDTFLGLDILNASQDWKDAKKISEK
ncbi:hypothetical protein O181_045818 [Austropuccinia psidii MF-1]|uniref:Uncharacterized protein n=1 Tax=Austropuccinia psidii MF-1 TaxID=1389203 RepID=A0A9Q3DR18_9BASI|nr:hypothetical protein [Austropuccinia psidii MF-1]